MDSIDITDSTFSLDVPDLNKVIDSNNGGGIIGGGNSDYIIYIYIGISILIAVIGIFIFHNFMKFYQNKKSENIEDCPGGFCTMEQSPRTI